MTLTRIALCALAIAALVIFPTAAHAGGGGDKPFHGVVSAVDTKANTITVTKKKTSEAMTFQAASAKITVNGAAGKLADITVGMHASVTVGATTGVATGVATAIEASTGKKDKGGKAPATPAMAPATTGTATPTQ